MRFSHQCRSRKIIATSFWLRRRQWCRREKCYFQIILLCGNWNVIFNRAVSQGCFLRCHLMGEKKGAHSTTEEKKSLVVKNSPLVDFNYIHNFFLFLLFCHRHLLAIEKQSMIIMIIFK